MQASATNYYIRNGGSDAALGTSEATAWATIAKLNTVVASLVPGDSVKFMVNEIHTGQILTAGNGSTGNPVVFCSYGGTGKAILSGFASLNSWSSLGSNIWQASVNSGAYMDVFVMNNQFVPMGRTPNAGSYFNIDSYQNSTGGNFDVGYTGQTITSTGTPAGTQNWVGARVAIRKNPYNIDIEPVISHSGNVIGYSTFNGNPVSDAGNKFFVLHHAGTLNQQNEWYYDAAAGVVKMYSTTDPSSMGIRVGKENFAYRVNDLSGGNAHDVTFRNLIFQGYDSIALCFVGMDNMTIDSCEFYFSGADHISVYGGNEYGDRPCNNIVVKNSKFLKAGNTSVFSKFVTGTRILNNTIDTSGLVEGMGKPKNQQRNGITVEQTGTGDSVIIYGNRITYSGYCGIRWTGQKAVIAYNFINWFGLATSDGGGIYTSREAGDSVTAYRQMHHNIIMNGIGNNATLTASHSANGGQPGIYNDDRTINILHAYNTIVNASRYGMFLHNNKNITFQYNNVFNNKDEAAIGSAYDLLEPGYFTRGLNIQYNNIYTNSPKLLDLVSLAVSDVASYGTINNNYYSRTGTTDMFRAIQNGSATNYSSLASWTSALAFDAASTYLTVVADSAALFYNATMTTAIQTFPGETYRDLQGNNFTNAMTLAPFESKIVRKVSFIAGVPTDYTIPRRRGQKRGTVIN